MGTFSAPYESCIQGCVLGGYILGRTPRATYPSMALSSKAWYLGTREHILGRILGYLPEHDLKQPALVPGYPTAYTRGEYPVPYPSMTKNSLLWYTGIPEYVLRFLRSTPLHYYFKMFFGGLFHQHGRCIWRRRHAHQCAHVHGLVNRGNNCLLFDSFWWL